MIRVRRGETDRWAWRLSDADRDALLLERDIGGTVATAHEQVPGGGVRLLARRLTVKGAAGMGQDRARIAQEGPAAFGKRPRAAEIEKPLTAHSRPFQRPTQRWAEAERRAELRAGRLLGASGATGS